MLVLRKKMRFCWKTQLEAKLKVSRAIVDIEIEGSLAGSPRPDIDHLLEAPEEEGFLSE